MADETVTSKRTSRKSHAHDEERPNEDCECKKEVSAASFSSSTIVQPQGATIAMM